MITSADYESTLHQLQRILQAHPGGIREYDLLNELRDISDLEVFNADFGDSLLLFQAHFILFHLLYKLRARLRKQRAGDMDIHCLNIILTAKFKEDSSLPDRSDPLQAYYMDLKNLANVDREEVQQMIGSFWKLFDHHEGRPEALSILGLTEQATQSEIKHRYRQLVLEHHPDQGGSATRFQEIKAAAALLLDGKGR